MIVFLMYDITANKHSNTYRIVNFNEKGKTSLNSQLHVHQ